MRTATPARSRPGRSEPPDWVSFAPQRIGDHLPDWMRPPGLRIADYALDARTHVIEAEGHIDLYGAPALKERAFDVSDQGHACVIVDLSRVSFIDSAGLGALLDVLKVLDPPAGSLALVVTDYDIERLLGITGLDENFTIHRSRDAAVEALSSSEANETAG